MSAIQKMRSFMMEDLGVTKEIDSPGRLVIPKEFRERLALQGAVELIVTPNGLLIRNPAYRLVKTDGVTAP